MPKACNTIEARFCDDLFKKYSEQAKENPMWSLMLSSVGDLVKMVDNSPSAQGKVREILNDICEHWPVIREMNENAETDELPNHPE